MNKLLNSVDKLRNFTGNLVVESLASVLIIAFFLSPFLAWSYHNQAKENEKSLRSVCKAYSSIVGSLRKETPREEFERIIHGSKKLDSDGVDGRFRKVILSDEITIQRECDNKGGSTSFPTYKEIFDGYHKYTIEEGATQ